MSSPAVQIALTSLLLAIATITIVVIYVIWKYTPIIGRIFEEMPRFLPLRVTPIQGGEDVKFSTADGLELVGTYLKTRTAERSGVLIFCHEYLSDRWSVIPYLDSLRDQGFDLFTFDFRNHGQSASDPIYKPLHWVTDHEVNDLRAAITYLRTRPDADPAGFGLFGVSRGGGTALCVSGRDPTGIWGVITDGAFPTKGTLQAYLVRWAEIFVSSPYVWKFVPVFVFRFLGWVATLRTQVRLHCRYTNVEREVSRIAPRPWFSIHGQKDAYISVKIAEGLFRCAGDPKELWIVEGAKHNRCRDKDPAAYQVRILDFVRRSSPRRFQKPAVETPVVPLEASSLHQLPISADLDMAASI